MVNWKQLTTEHMATLGLSDYDGEVVLVDPTAEPLSGLFFMFGAEKVFSEKQLKRYKKVTPTELKVVEAKLYERGRLLSMDYNEEEENDSARPDQ